MSDPFILVGDFQNVMGQPNISTLSGPGIPDADRIRLRVRLLLEEVAEVIGALRGSGDSERLTKIEFWLGRMVELSANISNEDILFADLENLAKELADVEVVTNGFAHECGIPLNLVMDEVARSNMSKLDDDGKPIFDAGGKVTKGPNYSPADVASVLYGPPKPAFVPSKGKPRTQR